MKRTTKPKLEDSWVDGDDTESSFASNEHSASSDSDVAQSRKGLKATPSRPGNGQTKESAREISKRSTRETSKGPDLVMPSINFTQGRSSNAPSGTTSSQLRQRPTPRSRPPQQPPKPSGLSSRHISPPSASTLDNVIYYLTPILEWIYDVLVHTLKFLKKPISWVLALYLFAGLVTLVSNLLTASIYTALSPICRIPGASFLNLPICTNTNPSSDIPDPEFSSLMSTQAQFSEILDSSTSSATLPMDMKRSETSIRDLRQIVAYSNLPTRNELGLEFDGFIQTARAASFDLQKFNSHVGRAVDIVLSTARWTEHVLDDLAHKASSNSISLFPSFLSSLLLPFQPIPFTPALLLDQYITHTRVISDEIESLISEAQALLLVLQSLEDRLDVIHSISLQTQQTAQGSKDEVLSHLWTILGGNRAKVTKFNKQLVLLRYVGEYRKIAWAHVTATILKLQAMGAELEELRTRVGSAELQREYGREAVPLSVHVESIRMGVARLEEGRDRARQVERNHVRRVLDDGNVIDGNVKQDLIG